MKTVIRTALRSRTTALLSCLMLAGFAPLAAAGSSYTEGCEAAIMADYETAYERWKPLAEDDGYAQFQLALMYHAGLHVEQDEAKAVLLYHMAARNGVPEAHEFLIAAYENGWFGLPKSQHLASFWQQKANPTG